MVINELKKVIIETVEFIIPPFVKLGFALVVLHFITYGVLSARIQSDVLEQFQGINHETVKSIIDSLYISKIIPLISVLVLITLAYLINKLTNFVGTIVPIYYSTTLTLRHDFYIIRIWKYFPEIKSLTELRLKINQLYNSTEIPQSSLNFEQSKYQEKEKIRLLNNTIFFNFLIIWSIICFTIVKLNSDTQIENVRFVLTLVFLLIIMVAQYFRIAKKETDIEASKLMVIDDFLRIDIEYKKTESDELQELIDREIRMEKYYSNKWWSVKIGYRLDWLLMYKNYRPPFYWRYKVWKERKYMKKMETK